MGCNSPLKEDSSANTENVLFALAYFLYPSVDLPENQCLYFSEDSAPSQHPNMSKLNDQGDGIGLMAQSSPPAPETSTFDPDGDLVLVLERSTKTSYSSPKGTG
jgi:hypothetical protein